MRDLTLEEQLTIIRDSAEPLKELEKNNDIARFLGEHAFHITMNANDVFGWACADAVDIAIEDLPKLLETEKLYGSEGVIAFLCHVAGYDAPQEPVMNAKIKEALEYLKDYKCVSWVLCPYGD